MATKKLIPANLKYWPHYCEENIWHLSQEDFFRDKDVKIIFISNPEQYCSLHCQKAGRSGVIVWDYHVVLLAEDMIWDFDTLLSFPCALNEYLQETFYFEEAENLRPRFKLIESPLFIKYFASDRKHMVGTNGKYLHDPPPWPSIQPDHGIELSRFIDMKDTGLGNIYQFNYQKVILEMIKVG